MSNQPANALSQHILYATQLRRQGTSVYQIRTLLKERGLSDTEAEQIVNFVRRVEQQQYRARSVPSRSSGSDGGTQMLMGCGLFIAGLVVTLYTMSAASDGGTYVICWGAMLFGAIQFLRGLMNSGN